MDNIYNPPVLSVHILLPEAIDRRLERRTREMPGASWPSWGGHITIVPNFVATVSVAEIQSLIAMVCADESPFLLHLSTPVAFPDRTRAEYFALFLTIRENDGDADKGEAGKGTKLHQLRVALLAGLGSLRRDLYPELIEQPYLPHVTLALGVSESEALSLVRNLRADPFEAAFWVEELWLVVKGAGEPGRIERISIPFGRHSHDTVLLH